MSFVFSGCISRAKGGKFLVGNVDAETDYLVRLVRGDGDPLIVKGKSILSEIIGAGWRREDVVIREYEPVPSLQSGPRPGTKAMDVDYFESDEVEDYDGRREDRVDELARRFAA